MLIAERRVPYDTQVLDEGSCLSLCVSVSPIALLFAQHGATAMHFAAMNARFEAMSYLMDRDVDINVQDSSGCTPLVCISVRSCPPGA